jgi:hypothetical protein
VEPCEQTCTRSRPDMPGWGCTWCLAHRTRGAQRYSCPHSLEHLPACRLGIPDSNIVLMVADAAACNPRNPLPGTIFFEVDARRRANLFAEGAQVDYSGREVNVEALLQVLTGATAVHRCLFPYRGSVGLGINRTAGADMPGPGEQAAGMEASVGFCACRRECRQHGLGGD